MAARGCSAATTAVAHRPSASFPTWTLAQVWVLARGALASRASHGWSSAVKVTLGSLYRQLEAQPHMRAWGQNYASGRGDVNGILYRRSLPVLMVVHLQSRARDQQAQAKGVAVVVPPVAEAALAFAYCARKSCP